MGKCKSYKKSICITMDKDVLEVVDKSIDVLNSKKNEKDPVVTRSMFIQNILVHFMKDVHAEATEILEQKGEKNNA